MQFDSSFARYFLLLQLLVGIVCGSCLLPRDWFAFLLFPGNESQNGTEGTKPVKYVNGGSLSSAIQTVLKITVDIIWLFHNFLLPVAVVRGRTRSLVERFELREKSSTDEFQAPDASPESISETAQTSPTLVRSPQPKQLCLSSVSFSLFGAISVSPDYAWRRYVISFWFGPYGHILTQHILDEYTKWQQCAPGISSL